LSARVALVLFEALQEDGAMADKLRHLTRRFWGRFVPSRVIEEALGLSGPHGRS
jgi:hypothetical protein